MMKATHHPTLEELSLYHDRALDPDTMARVRSHAGECGECRETLRCFETLGEAVNTGLMPDAEIDAFLDDNLKQLRARIFEEERINKYESKGLLSWLSPRTLGTALAVCLAAMIATFAWPPAENGAHIAERPGAVEPAQDDSGPPAVAQAPEADPLTEEQVRLAANLARRIWDSGMQYASANRERVTESVREIDKEARQALAMGQIPRLLPGESGNEAEEGEEPPAAIVTLANVGKQQITIGLGVSMLSLAVGL